MALYFAHKETGSHDKIKVDFSSVQCRPIALLSKDNSVPMYGPRFFIQPNSNNTSRYRVSEATSFHQPVSFAEIRWYAHLVNRS